MNTTTTRFIEPARLLVEDHKKVKALFARYEKLGKENEAKKAKLFKEIREELTIHTAIEERLFYPAFESLETEKAKEMVGESLEEHHVVKFLLKELSGMRPGDPRFDSKMTVLSENVLHHAGEEEEEMFPKAKRLPQATRERLSLKMQSMKESLKR